MLWSPPQPRSLAAAPCPSSPWSAPSGATRGRAGSSTTWRDDADLVIRYGGGNNAGHTVVNPHGHFKLHLIPSGIFHPGHAQPARQRRGHQPAGARRRARRSGHGRLRRRQPVHQRSRPPRHAVPRPARPARGAGARRRAARDDLAGHRPGVRRQGRAARDPRSSTSWSPTPSGRAWTTALPTRPALDGRLRRRRDDRRGRRRRPTRTASRRPISPPGTRLARHVVDGQALVDEALERGERILLEGQLGTMRDIDWGIYPYVTSSSPIPGGASLGAGLPAVRDRPRPRRGEGVHHRRRRRAAADRARRTPTVSCCASAERSTGPRPAGRADAAGTTRSPSASACGWPVTRASRSRSSTCSTGSSGCAWRAPTATRPTDASGRRCRPRHRSTSGWSRCTRSCRAGGRDTTGCRAWADAAAGGARVRRAPRGAGGRADLPRVGRPGARPDDRSMKLGVTERSRVAKLELEP